MIYVIPTFQNPSGRTLSLERRKAVAELAAKYDVLVLEDDPIGISGTAERTCLPSSTSTPQAMW